jgi:hypothetical protein
MCISDETCSDIVFLGTKGSEVEREYVIWTSTRLPGNSLLSG